MIDALNAGSRALADVRKQAGPALALCPIVNSSRTAPDWIDLQKRVQRLSDGPGLGVGAKVFDSPQLAVASYESSWNN
ncbi:MAG: hypothetical protein VW500_05810, partial [Aquiluna sp.]